MYPILFATAKCSSPTFLGIFPSWYEYLPRNTQCDPTFLHVSEIWLVVAAVIELLLRLAAIVAVGVIIYAAIMFTTSQGSPEQTAQARNTIINALIGLAISVMASVFVAFIASRF